MTWSAYLERARFVLPGLVCIAIAGACGSDTKPQSSRANGGSSPGVGGGSSGGVGGSSGGATAGSGGLAGSSSGGSSGSGGSAGTGGKLGSEEEYPVPQSLPNETGADLWLRYPQVPIPGRLGEYQAAFTHVVSEGGGASTDLATAELVQGLSGLTGTGVTLAPAPQGAGAVVVGTPATSALIAGLPLASELSALGPEGYLVRTTDVQGQSVVVVAANTEVGVLYGSFALLRHLSTHSTIQGLSLAGSPKVKVRILNHWDNLDGSVERGYAGSSLWRWNELPGTLSPRYAVGSSRVDLQACKLEYSIVSPK